MATPDPISTPRLDDCACGAVAGRVQKFDRPGRAVVAGRHQQSRGFGLQHRTFCSFRSPAGNLPHRVAGSGDRGTVVLLLAILHRLVGLLVALKIAFLAMFAAGGAQGTASVPPLLRKGRQNVGDLVATAAPADHDSRPAHPAVAIWNALLTRDAASHPWPVKSAASFHAPRQGRRTSGMAIGSRWLQPLSVLARETGPVPGRYMGRRISTYRSGWPHAVEPGSPRSSSLGRLEERCALPRLPPAACPTRRADLRRSPAASRPATRSLRPGAADHRL